MENLHIFSVPYASYNFIICWTASQLRRQSVFTILKFVETSGYAAWLPAKSVDKDCIECKSNKL